MGENFPGLTTFVLSVIGDVLVNTEVLVVTTNNPSPGLLGTEFGGLRHMQNSAANAKTTIYTSSGR